MSYVTLLVFLTTSLLGATAGMLGCFAILRGRALVGDVLAHAALPGICLAFLIVRSRDLSAFLTGALIAGIAAVALMALIRKLLPTKDDAVLGIVLSVFFGLGVMLLSVIQKLPEGGNRAGLTHFLFGQAAAISRNDLLLVFALSLVATGAIILLYKELVVASFDPTFARVQGWPVGLVDLALFSLVALVTMLGLAVVGVVLMAALLIMPSAAARFWTDRLDRMLLVAGGFGACAAVMGTASSAGWVPVLWGSPGEKLRLPTGPMIILSGAALFLGSMLFAPRKGVVSRAARLLTLRFRAALDHLLRELYEQTESALPQLAFQSSEQVRTRLGWTKIWMWMLTRYAWQRGWIRIENGQLGLLPSGLHRALQVVRAHRLWELFLLEKAGIASDHVHRDADAMEHLLPPEYVAQLEVQLAVPERLTQSGTSVPSSPH